MTDDRSSGLFADDRAVSVTVGYVLNLAVATLLLSGLFIAGGSFVENEREQAVQGELTVVGERVAADLMTVDRLARTASTPSELTIERTTDLPPRVSGVGYRLTIAENGTAGTIRLESERVDSTVEIPFRSSETVTFENTTVAGGNLEIRYEWDDGAAAGERKRVVIES